MSEARHGLRSAADYYLSTPEGYRVCYQGGACNKDRADQVLASERRRNLASPTVRGCARGDLSSLPARAGEDVQYWEQ